MTPEDAQGAVRALLVFARETGMGVSIDNATPEFLDALAAQAEANGALCQRYVGRSGEWEWDAVATGLRIFAHSPHRYSPVGRKETP